MNQSFTGLEMADRLRDGGGNRALTNAVDSAGGQVQAAVEQQAEDYQDRGIKDREDAMALARYQVAEEAAATGQINGEEIDPANQRLLQDAHEKAVESAFDVSGLADTDRNYDQDPDVAKPDQVQQAADRIKDAENATSQVGKEIQQAEDASQVVGAAVEAGRADVLMANDNWDAMVEKYGLEEVTDAINNHQEAIKTQVQDALKGGDFLKGAAGGNPAEDATEAALDKVREFVELDQGVGQEVGNTYDEAKEDANQFFNRLDQMAGFGGEGKEDGDGGVVASLYAAGATGADLVKDATGYWSGNKEWMDTSEKTKEDLLAEAQKDPELAKDRMNQMREGWEDFKDKHDDPLTALYQNGLTEAQNLGLKGEEAEYYAARSAEQTYQTMEGLSAIAGDTEMSDRQAIQDKLTDLVGSDYTQGGFVGPQWQQDALDKSVDSGRGALAQQVASYNRLEETKQGVTQGGGPDGPGPGGKGPSSATINWSG